MSNNIQHLGKYRQKIMQDIEMYGGNRYRKVCNKEEIIEIIGGKHVTDTELLKT